MGNRAELDVRGGQWIEYKSKLSSDTIMLSVADLLHLSRGDVFIGNLGSFYSWLAFFTIIGRIGRMPPFWSVQGASLCPMCMSASLKETAQWCIRSERDHMCNARWGGKD